MLFLCQLHELVEMSLELLFKSYLLLDRWGLALWICWLGVMILRMIFKDQVQLDLWLHALPLILFIEEIIVLRHILNLLATKFSYIVEISEFAFKKVNDHILDLLNLVYRVVIEVVLSESLTKIKLQSLQLSLLTRGAGSRNLDFLLLLNENWRCSSSRALVSLSWVIRYCFLPLEATDCRWLRSTSLLFFLLLFLHSCESLVVFWWISL